MAGNPSVPLAFKCFQPEANAEEKPPIIFLHGVTASKEHWKNIPQEVANATKRKVYVIDARNHGDSEWSDVFNFDLNVDDLLHFMDYIRAPKATLVGHSMGGITGIKTAMRAPERVEKLVVEDMYVKKIPQDALNMVLMFVSLSKAAIQEVPPVGVNECKAKDIIGNFILDKLPEDMRKLTKFNSSVIQLKQTSGGLYCYKSNISVLEKAMKDFETLMTENIGKYHGPAAFIYGSCSVFLIGEEKESIRNCFPNAEFVEIQNATHDVHGDCPEEFTKSLLELLLK